jgi:protein arginine kinase
MSQLTDFAPTARWMRRGGRENDVVLSSRVRLARNLERYNFPHLAAPRDLLAIRDRAFLALEKSANGAPAELLRLDFSQFALWERQSLLDRHFTSREHIKEETGRALCATNDGALSVLINEEDHLRVQSLLPGLQLDTAYALADSMDDALESYFDARGGLAFDAQFGYLTACPTNAGTGLRMSAMLHLPALDMVGKLENVRDEAQKRGLALRGTFGEGSKVWGDLHQLSNQVTLGLDEAQITLEMEAATRQVCEQERAAREILPERFGIEARDRIGRAFGTLRYARTISCREASDALSMLRLGHEIGWMKGLARQKFNELLVQIRPAVLQVERGQTLSGVERDAQRAEMMRSAMARVKLENEFENL